MATRTFLARNGTDRLVASTICTHFIFFHEAGFSFRTEQKLGRRWIGSDEAEQPRDVRCTFNHDADPEAFGATPQSGTGFYKLSCDHMAMRTHCVNVVRGGPTRVDRDAGKDARSVRNVRLRFTYDGRECTLAHSNKT